MRKHKGEKSKPFSNYMKLLCLSHEHQCEEIKRKTDKLFQKKRKLKIHNH